MSSRTRAVKRGVLIGTGADRTVITGFKPDSVVLRNITDGIDCYKSDSMLLKKARNEDIAGAKTFVDAITINEDGFTIEASKFVSTKEYHYRAEQEMNES